MSNKVTLVIAASDGIELTAQAVRSAKEFTKTPFEIIVIDNQSKDGTADWLAGQKDVKVIKTEKLESYGTAINMGLHAASKDSNYFAVLNNDLIFTPGWDTKCIETIEHPERLCGIVDKIGIVGPMSNHVAGHQLWKNCRYNLSQLNEFSSKLEEMVMTNPKDPKLMRTGFLSGFCWIMSRECYEAVGNMATFEPLGFEDNDYVLRAELAGYASVICRYSFVHHFGGQTTLRLDQGYAKRGMINRFPFYNKYKELERLKAVAQIDGVIENITPDNVIGTTQKVVNAAIKNQSDNLFPKKKLVAGYRVKNVGKWFERVLTKMETIADEIVIFNDHSTDNTIEIAKKHPKVTFIHENEFPEGNFNEARDREKLLQLCKSLNPDWIIITDGDEELEAKFDRVAAEKLMNPIKPNTFAYVFRYITHWDSVEMQRTDGIFGQMINTRMFRNLPNQHIISSHPQGFHCNSIPMIPDECLALSPLRIRHYGYVDLEDRIRKYEWYQKMDKAKDKKMIGAENYDHLVDIKVQLVKYDPGVTLGLAMITKNEEENLEIFLDTYHTLFHEIVIVDTGSTDKTKEIAKFYGAKVFDFKWKDDFATARQFAKDQLTTTWVFQLDPDETLGDIPARFYRMIEEPLLGYMSQIINHLATGRGFISENVRLFRNLPEIKYSGKIHEGVGESIWEIKGKGQIGSCINPNEALHHLGYLKHPLAVEKKLRQYAGICRTKLSKNPNDGMAHFSLALDYLNRASAAKVDKDKKKLEKQGEWHFEQAMIHSPKLIQSNQQLALLYIRKAKKCLEGIVGKTNPANPTYQNSMQILQTIKPFAEEMEVVGLPMADIK